MASLVVDEANPHGDVFAQLELFSIYFIAGLGILLRNVVCRAWQKHQRVDFTTTRITIFVQEFLCAILPMVLAQTIFADRIVWLSVGLTALIAAAVFAEYFFLPSTANSPPFSLTAVVETSALMRNSVAGFRTLVFVSTSIAILAVDFEVFPRRFAKNERFGHSLMDSGTAAFVFINGLSDYRNCAANRGGGKRNPYVSVFSLRVPSFFVLLLMGIGRSVFILLYGYQHKVTEYGVHWNFFVTLFFLRLFVELFSYPYSMYVGLCVGAVYEIALTKFGWAHFILRDEAGQGRSGFLDENREGIFSMFGYIFLYSLALLYAKISTAALQRKPIASLPTVLVHFLCFVGFFVGLQKFAEHLSGLPASRRLANMPYTFSMAAIFSFSVTGLQLLGCFVPAPPTTSKHAKYGLFEALNRNGLLYFLVSNLVTGLVNIFVLNVYKLEHNAAKETIFIILYAFVTTLFITIINWKRKEE